MYLSFNSDVCVGTNLELQSLSQFDIHGLQCNNRYEGISTAGYCMVLGY